MKLFLVQYIICFAIVGGEFIDLGSSKYRKNIEEETLSESLSLSQISNTQEFEEKWFTFLTAKKSN